MALTVKRAFDKLKTILRETFGHSKNTESAKSKGKKPARTTSLTFSSNTFKTGRTTNNIPLRPVRTRRPTPGPSSSRRPLPGSTPDVDYPLYGVPWDMHGTLYHSSLFDSSATLGGGYDTGPGFDGGACGIGGGDAGGGCACD
jgi:hypothetical protein